MKFFTRRRAAVLATAVALAAGSLATAPAASADAGPWPGTEGKILFDGPQLYDPATGAVTQVPNTYDGDWSAWAPDGSRLVSAWQDVQSIRPSGASKVTLPDGGDSTPATSPVTSPTGGAAGTSSSRRTASSATAPPTARGLRARS
ncbi:hypothetical protein [Streptomyces longhuiensis]|uniref:hypothetical protein n=1 Tax=Streptomyces longhuiensis TaxID=2880933 RepID=UPI001D0A22CC|nr:hypothetical protein [Streptomyces longhuiensis]UDM01597.1 hypothetical protein LGI35_26675 [Streptomyces longhuiensis]